MKKAAKGLLKWALTTSVGFSLFAFAPLSLLMLLRTNASGGFFREKRISFNPDQPLCQLTDFQGRLGCLELKRLDIRNRKRRDNALKLMDMLQGISGLKFQDFNPGATNTFNALAARVSKVQFLNRKLLLRGIDIREDYMEWFGDKRSFEEEVVYLPNHPGMSEHQVEYMAETIKQCLTD